MLTLDDLAEPAPPSAWSDWNDDGVVILEGLIGDELIDAYEGEWCQANGWHALRAQEREFTFPDDGLDHAFILEADRPGGWPDCTPYMRHRALRDLCCHRALATELHRLLGEPAGVHLNLTGWVTTERDWHQDTYLNEPEVGDVYAAVWFALGDVHPDSGPFQYVPGSHRWHRLMRDKIVRYVDPDDTQWPAHTEAFLSPLVEKEIADRGAEMVSHLPRRGDVLIWHSRLYHRGSKANVPGAYRPALIAHYSGVHHRPMMPPAQQAAAGGWYFPLGGEYGVEGNVGR